MPTTPAAATASRPSRSCGARTARCRRSTSATGPTSRSGRYMLDVSRDRVPTRATLGRSSTCSPPAATTSCSSTSSTRSPTATTRSCGATPRRSRPTTSAGSTRVCAAAGIELVGNQNCFGHLAPWLRHDAYRDPGRVPRRLRGRSAASGCRPSVLAPTQANADFVVGLVREQLGRAHQPARQRRVRRDVRARQGRQPRRGSSARARPPSTPSTSRRIVEPLLADGLRRAVLGRHHRPRPGRARRCCRTAT